MAELKDDDLWMYRDEGSDKQIRPATDFTVEVLDYFMHGESITGVKTPFSELDGKFRLRKEEVTLLGGVNGSGKSLLAGQCLLWAMHQGEKCLSVSLEMSPKAQLARMWRQASLEMTPTLDYGLGFSLWAGEKLWFYDQTGSVDVDTLLAVLRYSVDTNGTKFIVIDSLMTISGIRHDDYSAQKEIINVLANAARDLECHILLVVHARKGMNVKERIDKFSIRGASEIVDRADNLLLLHRFYEKMDKRASGEDVSSMPDATLTVAKARHFDQAECRLDLFLDSSSMQYYIMGHHPFKVPIDTKEPDYEPGVSG